MVRSSYHPGQMSQFVRITDVSPRDGLQNEPGFVPTADKAALVRALSEARVDEIEVTSFVSPRWVPQMGDAAELMAMLASAPLNPAGSSSTPPVFSALVPNEKGMASAEEVNDRAGRRLLSKISVFTAASESFNRRNTNASIAESIERFGPVVRRAHERGLRVRGYVSCAIACPFEGPIAPSAVVDVALKLLALSIDEIDLGDTIGVADVGSTSALVNACRDALGEALVTDPERFTLHMHDTFGRAAECIELALSRGVRSFDSAVGGLGGCPYASTPTRRAPGNVATDVVLHAVERLGFKHHVDQDALARAAELARRLIARPVKDSVKGPSGGPV